MKPILFNTEMIRAILEGRKTVTRRKVKFLRGWNPKFTGYISDGALLYGSNNIPAVKAPYRPGDILWVRETWCESLGKAGKYFYRAYAGPRDEMKEYAHSFNHWCSSIHMPREAARIFLRVTGVRVERLQEIDDPGVVAEGLEIGCYFDELWDSTIKAADRPTYGWEANPWVWVIEFERISKEEAAHDE